MSIDLDRLHARFTEQRGYEVAISGGMPSPGLIDCNDILTLIAEVRALRGEVAVMRPVVEAADAWHAAALAHDRAPLIDQDALEFAHDVAGAALELAVAALRAGGDS